MGRSLKRLAKKQAAAKLMANLANDQETYSIVTAHMKQEQDLQNPQQVAGNATAGPADLAGDIDRTYALTHTSFRLADPTTISKRKALAHSMSPVSPEGAYFARYLSIGAWAEKKELWDAVLQDENNLRKLFAQGRRDAVHEEIKNPFVGLVRPITRDVPVEIRSGAPLFAEEKEIPALFPVLHYNTSEIAMTDQTNFILNWRSLTDGSLHGLDWSNVFAAGGSILACLQPAATDNPREFFNSMYPSSDVDLFIYGLDEAGAKKKMNEIYKIICRNIPFETLAFRTANAVTVVSQYPYRHIQIVLRLYHSPSEVLAGFDVDACSVGFDGTDVWFTRRAHMALTSSVNTIDMSRRSPTYELRLAKYADRGLEVRVPGLDLLKVDPQIFARSFEKSKNAVDLFALNTSVQEHISQWRGNEQTI
ncbi:hypothetical protein HK405_014679 [Cladochytrium tenue]|nr:hypothetical protein HK405_014679 [Cladochytrium tenue]